MADQQRNGPPPANADAPVRRRLHTIAELAGQWSVSERTVRRLIERGQLGALRIGGQLRVPPEAVARYEARHQAVLPGSITGVIR